MCSGFTGASYRSVSVRNKKVYKFRDGWVGIIPGVSFALLGGGEGIRNDGSEAQVSLGPASDPSRASSHKYLLFMRRDTANKKSREVLIFKLQTHKEQCGETNCIARRHAECVTQELASQYNMSVWHRDQDELLAM